MPEKHSVSCLTQCWINNNHNENVLCTKGETALYKIKCLAWDHKPFRYWGIGSHNSASSGTRLPLNNVTHTGPDEDCDIFKCSVMLSFVCLLVCFSSIELTWQPTFFTFPDLHFLSKLALNSCVFWPCCFLDWRLLNLLCPDILSLLLLSPVSLKKADMREKGTGGIFYAGAHSLANYWTCCVYRCVSVTKRQTISFRFWIT